MASPAKTTSSLTPCRNNPNKERSELCDPIRRSFSGNPFTKTAVITDPRAFKTKTPANSPSDFPRRHSTGRGSVDSLRDLDKENSKDQNPKPTRLRSPAPSKGTKNFMAPTISAASKINASPIKKVLVERNEPARSSVSFSDIKGLTMEDNESTPEIALKQKKVSFSDVRSLIMEDNESTPEVGLNQKVSFIGVKSMILENKESTRQTGLKRNNVEMPHELQRNYHEYNYKEPFKSSADVKSKIVEDKSTQQTRLKQNNVELPHEFQSDKCKEFLKSNVDSLMETFPEEKCSVKVIPSFEISPKASDLAPLDADPLMLPYDPKTNCLSPRPQFLHYRPNPRIELYRERDSKQLDECFTTESSSDTDFTEETQSEDISSEETKPITASVVEKGFEDRRMSKSRFPTRSKFIALLLVLAFAYLSVLAANSPAFTSNLEELSLLNFHVPPEVTGFAKVKFKVFTGNLQHWSASFLSYVSDIVSSSRQVDRSSLFEYANLSHVLQDPMMFDHSVTVTESVRGRDDGIELFDNKYYGKIEADEAVDEYEQLEDQNLELFSEGRDADEDEKRKNEDFETSELVSEEETVALEQEIGAEMIEHDRLEAGSNVELKDHDHPSIMIPRATETMFPEDDSTHSSQNSVDDSTINGFEDQFLSKNTTGFALLVLCLVAASALIYTKRGNASMPNASVPMKQPVSTGPKDKVHEGRSSMNLHTEMDTATESCPSYMSSCHSKGLKEPNEYQSQERKTRKTHRRESLASSDYSMGSSSYGSFTTYDKISSKLGGGDKVTPVRRSSRIWNQVASPQ